MNRIAAGIFCTGVVALLLSAPASAQPLIPRDVLFGNPDRTNVQLSYDGKQISWLAPKDGVLNVWVAPTANLAAARCVTADPSRGIRFYRWAYTNQHIIYQQDEAGDENWNVHVVDLSSGQDTNLTPQKNVHARIERLSARFPDEILVGLNDRVPQFHDLWRINIRSGEKKLTQENPGTINGGTVISMLSDEDLSVRLITTFTSDGGQEIFQPATSSQQQDGPPSWERFAAIPMQDVLTTSVEAFHGDGQSLYMIDSREHDTSVLTMVDFATGNRQVLSQDARADVNSILYHPGTKAAQAVQFTYARSQWKTIDAAIEFDLQFLQTVSPGDLSISSRSLDDELWIVAYTIDAGPVKYFLYDRQAKKTRFLFTNRDDLGGYELAKMQPLVLQSRDGLNLVSYLTLPIGADSDGDGKPQQPLPMVLVVHGGPWWRDFWGYNPTHQWLANRGYAVLSVNFRGSTGFGKAFTNASNREWGGKMHDDLIDAVNHMIEAKIADPTKVGILGGSYGGYATLVGLTFTPETFACGVDIVGPSNINTLLATIPPYWAPAISLWKTRVGDHTTDQGREFLNSRSPLNKVHNIQRPLLIAQGANDPRVKQSESDQLVKAMQARNIPVTYVLYPDEGHGFARPENRQSFYAVTEAFLSEHLGGRCEPVGDDFARSTITVPAGADHVPGLSGALNQPR